MKKIPTITGEDGRCFLTGRIGIDELPGVGGDEEIGIYWAPVGKVEQ